MVLPLGSLTRRANVNGTLVTVGNRALIPEAASLPITQELKEQGKTLLAAIATKVRTVAGFNHRSIKGGEVLVVLTALVTML